MIDNSLTIILTLRGRHLHTLRWMWHANRTSLPYHIIIADGEVHPTIDRLLSDPSIFPNISYEYHRYRDLSLTDYYKKIKETIAKVATTYTMCSDNDDFVMSTGIQKSINYLKNYPEYVCAGGKIPNFSLSQNKQLPNYVIGEISSIGFGYKNQHRDISNCLPSERVLQEIDYYQPVWYHVFRTNDLRLIIQEIEEINFSDASIVEFYHALRAVTLGKVHTDSSAICYLRQAGTSTNSHLSNDWVYYLLRSKLPEDFRAIAKVIAENVEINDINILAEFKETILDKYASYLRHMLGHTMMRYRFPRLFKIKHQLIWIRKIQYTPKWLQHRLIERNLKKEVLKNCQDATMILLLKNEFQEIKETLQGDDYVRFLKAYANDLLIH